ncbi:MAG: MFS transporter [Patescibacteria group bacterium]
MATLRHLYVHVKNYGFGSNGLFLLGMLILFWAIFDGIISYIAPIIITQNGISKSMMGLIIGSSSVAGALFDFLMCRIFKSTYYRRMFLIMFGLCFIFPLFLWQAKIMSLYLIAMAIWGIYYDLSNFGKFDFITRNIKKDQNTSSFGVIQVFYSLGYLIAPLLATVVIGETIDWKPFAMAWVFIIISFIFFLLLIGLKRKERGEGSVCRKANFFAEFHLWGKIGRILWPVLILTFIINVIDAFFWTIGPLLAESLRDIAPFGGLLMFAYSFPALIVGWLTGIFTGKYGKKKVAFYCLLFGSIVLLPLFLVESAFLVIAIVLLSSFLLSFTWPSINGAYADYMEEAKNVEKEIEGIEDFCANLGYIVGPILAGVLSDTTSENGAFSILAAFCVLVALFLLKVTPRNINVRKQLSLGEID